MRLYVGNLPFSTTDSELREVFGEHGNVLSAQVIMDRETGRSRGFGFVEMDDAEAQNAINALDGVQLEGRALKVNEARERTRDGGGGGGGGWGGGRRESRGRGGW